MGGNFKFQVQDSFLEYLFLEIWRFEKRIALSEKKAPLGGSGSYKCLINFKAANHDKRQQILELHFELLCFGDTFFSSFFS